METERLIALGLGLLFPGLGTTVFEVVNTLRHIASTVRGNRLKCAHVVERVEFLCSELARIQDANVLEGNAVLPELATVINAFVLFMREYAGKHALSQYFARHDVDSRILTFHSDIDMLFQMLNMVHIAATAEWRMRFEENQERDRRSIEETLANTHLLLAKYRGRGLMEALMVVQFAIQNANGPNNIRQLTQADVALLQRTLVAMAAEANVALETLPPWYVPSDDVTFESDSFAVGTFGPVHYGKWNGAAVVVKQLLLVSEQAEQSFLTETTIWHTLDHPHIVRLYGACHKSTPLFLVSEFASAGSFRNYLDKIENKRRLWELFYQAAQGLLYLHSKRVVHADIKCSNLLVGDDGLAKLCDFGFSFIKKLSDDKSLKEQPSSARWKAPECLVEQGPAGNPTFASDVFSLGVSIVEAKTGNYPWEMKSNDEILDKILDGDSYPRPDDVFTDREWELVEGMTVFDPKKRWSLEMALEMLKELADEEAAADTGASYFLLDGNLTVRGRKLIDRIDERNQEQMWTQAQATQTLLKLIEEETTVKSGKENPVEEDAGEKSRPSSTEIQDKLERLTDHIQRTPSLSNNNDRDRFLRQVQQVRDWYQLEGEMATQWETNFPDIARCSSCENDNPLDNHFCCECGEAIVGGSWQARRKQLDFRFVVSDVSKVETTIAELEELCDHETAEAVVRVLRRVSKQVCPSCSHHSPAGSRICEECGATLQSTTADNNESLESSLGISVRSTLQSEIERLKRVLQHSREQEAASRKANKVPPLELPCSVCGELNSEFEVFCRECGHDIEIIRENPLPA